MRKAAAGVKGGVILFRGSGTAARQYLEADRSQADDYYLEGGTALAEFTITDTGHRYDGPPQDAKLAPGERVVVDEAGMIDQDTAIALFTVADEAGATVALVGDRAQLPAVGRGGVLDMAAHIRGRTLTRQVCEEWARRGGP